VRWISGDALDMIMYDGNHNYHISTCRNKITPLLIDFLVKVGHDIDQRFG
jgi:hypothetical protein